MPTKLSPTFAPHPCCLLTAPSMGCEAAGLASPGAHLLRRVAPPSAAALVRLGHASAHRWPFALAKSSAWNVLSSSLPW